MESVNDGPVVRLADPMPLRGPVPLFPFHAGTETYRRRNEPFLARLGPVEAPGLARSSAR